MEKHRIIVIGSNVFTVQCVSGYCLAQGADVFPYYGIPTVPTVEEITLFDPEIWVLCLPVPEGFRHQIQEPCILWSERIMDLGITLISTPTELKTRLQEEFLRLRLSLRA